MKTIGWLILFAVYTSPLTFILSGCQWKPDAPGNVVHVKTSDFLTPKVKPANVKINPLEKRSPLCDCGDKCTCNDSPTLPCLCNVVDEQPATPVTYDPFRVPAEDDPYAPPPRVVLPKSNPPLTNAEQLQQGDCANGMCSVQGGDSGERRGWRPLQRLRGRR